MKCTKCGSEIREGASFCTACGMPVMNQNSSMNDSQNNMTTNDQNNTVNSSNEVPNLFDNQESENTQMNTQPQNNMINNQGTMPNNNFNPQNNMMNNQVPYNNAVNNQNGKKTPVGLIIGVIVAAVVIIAVFVGLSMAKDNNSNNDTPNTNTQTDVDKNDKQDKEENPQTVTYSDYNFTVPADFNATPSTSQLLITSSDNNLAEAIIYQSGTGYDTLSSMKDQVVSLLQAQENSESYDFTNAVTTEKTYDGTRFLITSGIKQGTIDLDITYAETDGGVFVVSIAKTGGSINETDRQELYSIVASANQNNF